VPEVLRYVNQQMGKKELTRLIAEVYAAVGHERTVYLLDDMKALGFKWAAKAGITFAMTDMQSPVTRAVLLQETEEKVARVNANFRRGTISAGERKQSVLKLWTDATAQIGDEIVKFIPPFNPISIMTTSGARGSKKQISQLSGMRGLMADPFGNIIDSLPVKSNFHEGLSVLEYFVTTHGARKGLADTALRTADAGYLTRRLVDVAQDVIIREDDCGTEGGHLRQ
jgi:DNA-directed RNA polymerase subunit beta'